MRYLKPTKQRSNNNPIIGFDIETYGPKNKFLCGSFWALGFNEFFTDKKNMIEYLCQKKFRNSYVVSTNLLFDFFGLFDKSEEIKAFNLCMRGSELITARCFIDNSGKLHLRRPDLHAGRINFIDTLSFARLSVEKLGKIIKLDKLPKPKCFGRKPENDMEWDELRAYNLRDSEISCRFMEFLRHGFDALGASFKPTIASTSMSLFKNKYLFGVQALAPENILLDMFKGYYGGRTEVFSRGFIEYYNYYDFNSLYPASMINDFPDTNTLWSAKKDTCSFIDNFEGMSLVSITAPFMKYPLLPVRVDKKLYFPYGKFNGWYTHVELRKAVEEGYKINKVFKSYYYRDTFRPFDGFINELYALRKKYKANNDIMEVVVKLCMNSLYGKFGQKFEEKTVIQPFNMMIDEIEALEDFERIKDFIRFKEKGKPANFCFPIWAAYVTSYARIKLFDSFKVLSPAYCDTDSVITKKSIDTSNEIGEFKKEYFIKKGILVKPKFYIISGDGFEISKVKGVPVRFVWNDFVNLLSGKPVNYSKFVRVKEALRRDLEINEVIDICKKVSVDDDKRVWPGKFDGSFQDSLPVNISSISAYNRRIHK